MTRLLGVCGAIAAVMILGAADTDSPSVLLARIHQQGAKAVVGQLSAGDGAAFDHVLGQVASGTRPWLNAGLALKPGTDAGSAEALSVSMATALLSNPGDVLRLVVPTFGEERICAVPLIEPSPEQVARYVSRARAALAGVVAPELKQLARRCSALIGK